MGPLFNGVIFLLSVEWDSPYLWAFICTFCRVRLQHIGCLLFRFSKNLLSSVRAERRSFPETLHTVFRVQFPLEIFSALNFLCNHLPCRLGGWIVIVLGAWVILQLFFILLFLLAAPFSRINERAVSDTNSFSNACCKEKSLMQLQFYLQTAIDNSENGSSSQIEMWNNRKTHLLSPIIF